MTSTKPESESPQAEDGDYRKVILRAFERTPLLRTAAGLCREIETRFGRQAVIVGGAVRDILNGQPVADADIATAVSAKEISAAFEDSFGIGQSQRFGVTMVKWENHHFEVAQFRKDGSYSDSRRPDSVEAAGSFRDDAARRDFTVNAMAITSDAELLDYFGGIDDLRVGVLQTVGNPETRFQEDGLRILRAGRFASRFGFSLAPETRSAMKKRSEVVLSVSGERIREEFIKVAASGAMLARFVEILDDTDVLGLVIPEIKALQGLAHSPVHHPEGGVWEHVLAALRASRSTDPITNLAILFHDLGKATTGIEKDGRPSYPGHEAAGIPIFEKIAGRLRFSGEQRAAIELAILSHMLGHQFDRLSDKVAIRLRQHPHWPTLLATFHADEAARMHLFDEAAFEKKMQRAEELVRKLGAKQEFEEKMGQMINGAMILSLHPGMDGKEVGRIKNLVRDEILARHFEIDATEIEALIRRAAAKGGENRP